MVVSQNFNSHVKRMIKWSDDHNNRDHRKLQILSIYITRTARSSHKLAFKSNNI